jgi:hypothetical protein
MEEDKALTIPRLYLIPAIAYTSLSSDKKRKAEDRVGRVVETSSVDQDSQMKSHTHIKGESNDSR